MTQNIAVLGAGIMGIMAAHTLQESLPGTTVTLYDPLGFPADNASYMAGGMLSPFSEADHIPHHYIEAGFASIERWQVLQRAIPQDFDFHRNGSLLLAHAADRHMLERFKSILPDDTRWNAVTGTEIKALEPMLNFEAGLHMLGEGHLHPKLAMDSLLGHIKHKVQDSPEPTDIKADYVIDCRGLGDNTKPLRGVKGEIALVKNPDFIMSRPVRLMHPRYPLYIVPRADNIFMIGATIIESTGENSVSIRSGMELLSALYSLHRSFGDAEILSLKAGTRPAYADNIPRIIQDGTIISCNGLYRHGYLFAPVMADCVADMICGRTNPYLSLFTGAL